ncbi:GLPGLI family protein [Riemerella anatipestifer]|nr:GLPGLI family protein [Riemerella anatipestifer]
MKKIGLIISFLIYIVTFSQTYRFIYQLDMQLDDKVEKFNMVLDIDKDFVKFYDYKFLEMDSISKKTGENWQTNTMTDQLVLRKLNSNENTTFHDNDFDYFALYSTDKMNWKIEKEIKNLHNYKLQKATTSFGGRNWTAWFSEEIPFQEGPYKFRGLPGLIFELSDETNDFKYSLIKSLNLSVTFDTKNFLETHYGVKPIYITLKQYHKIKIDSYNDPVAEVRKTLKNGGVVNINGQNITSLEELDQKRKFLQEMIKKYYKPIEKNKAIPYP